jgi:anti-sigma28 factor (negative regulator of flagellin synthesis)
MRYLKAGGDVRADRVRRVKRAIEAGEYENDLKLNIAIDRMIGSLDEAPE